MTEQELREATEGYSPDQVSRALNLIAVGRIFSAGFGGTYAVISSDGSATYSTDSYGNCNCPAAGRCYHGAAAKMLAVDEAGRSPGRHERTFTDDELFGRL